MSDHVRSCGFAILMVFSLLKSISSWPKGLSHECAWNDVKYFHVVPNLRCICLRYTLPQNRVISVNGSARGIALRIVRL